jgi:beta-lactam-binding protein with PASTA domain
MASVATITPAAPSVTCSPGASAEHSFTVTNTTGLRLTVGLRVLPKDPGVDAWLSIDGSQERELDAGETTQVTVKASPPPGTPAGQHRFQLLVYSPRREDQDFSEGPVVTVEVPAGQGITPPPPPPPSFPWWIVAVAVLVLLVGGGVLTWVLMSGKTVEVPKVVGLSVEQAVEALQEAQLKPAPQMQETRDRPAGTVLEQSPAPGAQVDEASEVVLTVASAPSEEPAVPVPNVVSLTFDDAKRELTDKGFAAERMEPLAATREFRPGQVTLQVPPARSPAKRGSTVRLQVAGNSVEVPEVAGQTLQAAMAKLVGSKLVVSGITGDQDKLGQKVVGTSPPAGQLVLTGTEVTIRMPGGLKILTLEAVKFFNPQVSEQIIRNKALMIRRGE